MPPTHPNVYPVGAAAAAFAAAALSSAAAASESGGETEEGSAAATPRVHHHHQQQQQRDDDGPSLVVFSGGTAFNSVAGERGSFFLFLFFNLFQTTKQSANPCFLLSKLHPGAGNN